MVVDQGQLIKAITGYTQDKNTKINNVLHIGLLILCKNSWLTCHEHEW